MSLCQGRLEPRMLPATRGHRCVTPCRHECGEPRGTSASRGLPIPWCFFGFSRSWGACRGSRRGPRPPGRCRGRCRPLPGRTWGSGPWPPPTTFFFPIRFSCSSSFEWFQMAPSEILFVTGRLPMCLTRIKIKTRSLGAVPWVPGCSATARLPPPLCSLPSTSPAEWLPLPL